MLQVVLLLTLLIAATACQSQPPTPTVEVVQTPTIEVASSLSAMQDEPTPSEDHPLAKEMVAGLAINEDVKRSVLFNINSLAYELPGMDDVEVLNITYSQDDDRPLTLDIYYPPVKGKNSPLPLVIFGIGYKMSQEPLRNAHFYTSWGKLVAAAGMAAIVYDTEQPDHDLEILMAFIHENAIELDVDPDQIGLLSMSANTATVMSYLMHEGRNHIRFSVYYYGLTLTPDQKYKDEIAELCAGRGCLVPELANVTYVDGDLPLLVVKSGREHLPNLNEAMDYFVSYVKDAGAPVTFVEYPDGRHGFDTQQKTEESAEIIAQTVEFMKNNFGMD